MGWFIGVRRFLAGPGGPASWLVGVLVLDLATGSAFFPAVLYGIAPLLASARLRPRVTAYFAAAALVLTTISVARDGDWGTAEAWAPMADAALVGGVAVLLTVARVRREEQLARMVRIAEAAQRAILPLVPHRIKHLNVDVRYVSAAEDALVGGDLYDWFQSDGRVCFLVGECPRQGHRRGGSGRSGHPGVPAVRGQHQRPREHGCGDEPLPHAVPRR